MQDSSKAPGPRPGVWRVLAWLVLLPALLCIPVLALLPEGAAATALPPGPSWYQQALPRFLLQLLVVLGVARLAGVLSRRFGQPAVVGEMLAGLALGPSLLGLAWPDLHALVFPADGVRGLQLISQFGVLVFLFAAGAEFPLSQARRERGIAGGVALAGIALPFLLGVLLAWPLSARHAPEGTPALAFALFLGVALSVTAFPVLLRILDERGYRQTPIGRLAVACAAISDACAWALLGAIVAWVRGEGLLGWAAAMATVGALALLLLRGLRPWLARREAASPARNPLIGLVALALAAALVTELVGLHLLFGAFLAGLAVSAAPTLRTVVAHQIEPFAAALLVPLFFASTGLTVRVDLLGGGEWAWFGLLVVVATLGKLGGTVLAARACGVDRRNALRLGAMMNTRGLMELIVLALGYELGLIDARLYAMLVLVAIATTLMTGPLLAWIDRRDARAQSAIGR